MGERGYLHPVFVFAIVGFLGGLVASLELIKLGEK